MRDAGIRRKLPVHEISLPQLKKLLDSKHDQEILEGLRRVITVGQLVILALENRIGASILQRGKRFLTVRFRSHVEVRRPATLSCFQPSSNTFRQRILTFASSCTCIFSRPRSETQILPSSPSTQFRKRCQLQTHSYGPSLSVQCHPSVCPSLLR